ncbi:MAG: hypothetical protein V4603_07170 [Pseudomonadota bacterium]
MPPPDKAGIGNNQVEGYKREVTWQPFLFKMPAEVNTFKGLQKARQSLGPHFQNACAIAANTRSEKAIASVWSKKKPAQGRLFWISSHSRWGSNLKGLHQG